MLENWLPAKDHLLQSSTKWWLPTLCNSNSRGSVPSSDLCGRCMLVEHIGMGVGEFWMQMAIALLIGQE